MNIAKYIDHTILKPQASKQDIEKLCKEAIQYGFASVCVNACRVEQASRLLEGSGVNVACVVGFPLGATTTSIKVAEAKEAVNNGAVEIDMVINVGLMKDGDYDGVKRDIKAVVDGCGVTVKVILETCLLTKEEIVKACSLCAEAGAHFVKTSTGFSTGGATTEDVALMKRSCQGLKVKASGGIRDKQTALRMIEAGADRLGTSASIDIVK
ncbi:MAG: deoxyribose-phosphate aldolase [Christensenellales bacterium]